MNAWYSTLQRPALTPPDWIFAPVWTTLYTTIAIAIFLFYRAHAKPHLWLTTGILVFHLIANFSWTFLFFRLHSPAAALVDIIFMDLSLVCLMVLFWQATRPAALILVPYLLWILFATYLNYGFYRLN